METFRLKSGRTVPVAVRRSVRARRPFVRFLDRPDAAAADVHFEVVLPDRRWAPPPARVLAASAGWIERQMARFLRRDAAARLSPDAFLFRGRPIAARLVEPDLFHPPGRPVLADDELRLAVPGGDPVLAAGAFLAWLTGEAETAVRAALARRLPEMNRSIAGFRLRHQRTLWGSCSRRTGTLSFNRKLVMAPPAALDYVVVHEIAHLSYLGHGPRFWDLVARHCPDHRAARAWLSSNGYRLRPPAAFRVGDRRVPARVPWSPYRPAPAGTAAPVEA